MSIIRRISVGAAGEDDVVKGRAEDMHGFIASVDPETSIIGLNHSVDDKVMHSRFKKMAVPAGRIGVAVNHRIGFKGMDDLTAHRLVGDGLHIVRLRDRIARDKRR